MHWRGAGLEGPGESLLFWKVIAVGGDLIDKILQDFSTLTVRLDEGTGTEQGDVMRDLLAHAEGKPRSRG